MSKGSGGTRATNSRTAHGGGNPGRGVSSNVKSSYDNAMASSDNGASISGREAVKEATRSMLKETESYIKSSYGADKIVSSHIEGYNPHIEVKAADGSKRILSWGKYDNPNSNYVHQGIRISRDEPFVSVLRSKGHDGFSSSRDFLKEIDRLMKKK